MRGGRVCVGARDLDSFRSLRLFRHDGTYVEEDAALEIGDIWEVDYRDRPGTTPPHVEDVIVAEGGTRRGRQADLGRLIAQRDVVWTSVDELFDGGLAFTAAGTAYTPSMAAFRPAAPATGGSTRNSLTTPPTDARDTAGVATVRYAAPHTLALQTLPTGFRPARSSASRSRMPSSRRTSRTDTGFSSPAGSRFTAVAGGCDAARSTLPSCPRVTRKSHEGGGELARPRASIHQSCNHEIRRVARFVDVSHKPARCIEGSTRHRDLPPAAGRERRPDHHAHRSRCRGRPRARPRDRR
jgi:hypothetical protein